MPLSNHSAPIDRWRALAARRLNQPGGMTPSSRLGNALFILFIGGILAYGIVFAYYMLTRFDLFNLLRDVSGDDSFYYFQIARNLAEGKFSTFDGGITRTNGYHPLWLFSITPFYWIFDKEAALFAIKAFEIMLVAGGVALVTAAARLARMPWYLMFAALPMLYLERDWIALNRDLIGGLEAAAALFMLGLFILTACLFAQSPARWKWPLAAVAFALPWVRLEYIAISLATTAALCLVEWSRQDHSPDAPLGVRDRSVLSVKAIVPFLAAGAGILMYFAYNGIVFGGVTPVSGAVKRMVSQRIWEQEGGYSVVQNFRDFLQIFAFDDELAIALEVCAYVVLVWWFAHRSRSREDWLFLVFLTGAFGVAAGHLAKFAQSVLLVHPEVGNYGWYFVPAMLMEALIIPMRCYVSIYLIRRFIGSRSHRAANVVSLGVVVIGAASLLATMDFTRPFRLVDRASESSTRDWEITFHIGSSVMDRLLPEDSVVGSWSAGVIGYFSRFPVVNLDGLVNSHDYLRALKEGTEVAFSQRYGITHFADVWHGGPRGFYPDGLLFEGPQFSYGTSKLWFKLWLADSPPETLLSGFDPSAEFWDKMAPHFNYELEATAVIIDGNMAQVFVRDCALAETHDEALVFSWSAEEGETVSRIWRPWAGMGENSLGFCVDAFELPNDARPPIRIGMAPADSVVKGSTP